MVKFISWTFLTVSLLLTSTTSILAVGEKNPLSSYETDVTRPSKLQKTIIECKEQPPSKLVALRSHQEKIHAHNRQFLKRERVEEVKVEQDSSKKLVKIEPTDLGIFPAEIWENIGRLIKDTPSFLQLFSLNHAFVEMGESFAQRRPFPDKDDIGFGYVISEPLLPETFKRRHMLTYLMREDVIHDVFLGILKLYQNEYPHIGDKEEALHFKNRSRYYEQILRIPFLSAYFDLLYVTLEPFAPRERQEKARGKFEELMATALIDRQRMALELAFYSSVSNPECDQTILAKLYPGKHKPLRAFLLRDLWEGSHSPTYLLNLVTFMHPAVVGDCLCLYEVLWTKLAKPMLEQLTSEDRPSHPDFIEGIKVPKLTFSSTMEAESFYRTNLQHQAITSVLEFIIAELDIPTMATVSVLVQLYTHEIMDVFYINPEKIDYVEALLLKLLSFGNRQEVFRKYLDFIGPENTSQDPSIKKRNDIRLFALTNLVALHHQNEQKAKMELYASQIASDDEDGRLFDLLARTYLKRGDLTLAGAHYRTALSKGYQKAQEGLNTIQLALTKLTLKEIA